MGYYTKYELSWDKPELDDEIGDAIENAFDGYGVERDGKSCGECKWYDHDKDMLEFSRQFPATTFHLAGEGEDSGDIWDKFYLNGKSQCHSVEIVRQSKPDPKKWGVS